MAVIQNAVVLEAATTTSMASTNQKPSKLDLCLTVHHHCR